MPDFGVYRTAATRALRAEPLYRAEDGHYQFKYLPAFALAMAPFALLDPDAAKTIWFALSVGLLTAYLRWSVRALPERRRPDRVLLVLTVVLMAKFYLHELTLGQTNILLGDAARGRAARGADRPSARRGRVDWRGGLRQAVRARAAAVARVQLRRGDDRRRPRRARRRPGCCRRSSTAGRGNLAAAGRRGTRRSRRLDRRRICSAPTTSRWPRCGRSGWDRAPRPARSRAASSVGLLGVVAAVWLKRRGA